MEKENILGLALVFLLILLLSMIFIPKFTPLKELVLGVGGNICPQSGKTDSDYIKDIDRMWNSGNRHAAASLFIEYKDCFPHLVSSVSSDVSAFALNIEAERVNNDIQLELNTAISNLDMTSLEQVVVSLERAIQEFEGTSPILTLKYTLIDAYIYTFREQSLESFLSQNPNLRAYANDNKAGPWLDIITTLKRFVDDGQLTRAANLFIRLDRVVPEDHVLRTSDNWVSVEEATAPFRPS